MAHKPQIQDLSPANGQNYFGLTSASGVQEYRQLDPGDYTVSGDVNNNGMAFADVVAGNAPAVTAIPPGAPVTPSNTATLQRKYNDLFRIWSRVAGVWSHAYDIPRFKHIELLLVYRVEDPVTAAITPKGAFFITPSELNGASLSTVIVVAANGAFAVDVDIRQNGIVVATILAASIVPTTINPGTLVATNDIWDAIPYNPTGPLFGLTVTLVFNPL